MYFAGRPSILKKGEENKSMMVANNNIKSPTKKLDPAWM